MEEVEVCTVEEEVEVLLQEEEEVEVTSRASLPTIMAEQQEEEEVEVSPQDTQLVWEEEASNTPLRAAQQTTAATTAIQMRTTLGRGLC